jgi:hypothetical protein
MSDERPTDSARYFFNKTLTYTWRFKQNKDPADLANALGEIAQGLDNLAVAVRATYILLEEVKRKQGQQAGR